MLYRRLKKRTYDVLEKMRNDDAVSRYVNLFIMLLIIANVCAIILETEPGIYSVYSDLFWYFEVFSVAIFSVEYLCRFWVCTENPVYAGPVRGRIKYALSAMSIIDLLAIAPFYLPMLLPINLRVLRMLRIFRIFRLFKLARYSDAIMMFGNVLRSKKEELLITLLIGLILLVISSTFMYYAENEAQPDKFSSISTSMWWAIVTLATVGYGDVFPVTPIGRFFGALTAMFGIGMFALPAGLLGSAFVEELQHQKRKKSEICPHCGRDIREKAESADAQPEAPVPVIVVKDR